MRTDEIERAAVDGELGRLRQRPAQTRRRKTEGRKRRHRHRLARIDMPRILILGGTTEARRLAERLVERADVAVTVSLAGRTTAPATHAVPVRIGGFGGAEGLGQYLTAERVDALVDATHPYAAIISANPAD